MEEQKTFSTLSHSGLKKRRPSSLHPYSSGGMAEPRSENAGGGGARNSRNSDAIPIARLVSQGSGGGGDDDVAVVVGQLVPAPTVAAYAVSAAPEKARTTLTPEDKRPPAAAANRSASAPPYTAPIMHSSTGTFTLPGTRTSGGARHSGGASSSSMRGSGSWAAAGGENRDRGGGVAAAGDAAGGGEFPLMTHTGTTSVPGCGTSSSTGGRCFEGDQLTRTSSGRSAEHFKGGRGRVVLEDEEYVDKGGGVLVACGQGKSLYDVKGCLSSWVLVRGGGRGGSAESDAVRQKLAAVGDGAGAGGSGPSWALRSDANAAGDGGVTCSACVPSAASGKGPGTRMLITGGKDSVLREWAVEEGRPRLVAEIPGHSDWISCCALVPSTSTGAPPSVAVSGGRDGTVRFWTKSADAAAAAAADAAALRNEEAYNEKTGMLRAAFASGSRSSSGRSLAGVGGGTGGSGVGPPGSGRWCLGSTMSAAHGSSEFVTCCASPGGRSGAIGGWVATGGTDWTVRLWDVVKSRELGRLSFMGHSHPVRSLACSSDGNMLVSGGEDHKVIVWSPQSRRPLATLKGHASTVHGLAIDPGMHSGNPPRWIASGGGEGFLLIWDPRNWASPVATLLGEVDHRSPADSTLSGAFSSGVSMSERHQEGSLTSGLAGARLRGESGRWEGETTGATMLNSVNCLAAGGAPGGGEWLFAGGETIVRSWQRKDGVWHGGTGLPGDDLGGVASLSAVE